MPHYSISDLEDIAGDFSTVEDYIDQPRFNKAVEELEKILSDATDTSMAAESESEDDEEDEEDEG